MNSNIWIMIAVFLVSYFIGSLSPAVILSKRFAGYDIRTKGSKNAGSTNVFRVMGPKYGIINFLLDGLKGFIPTLLGMLIANRLGIAEEIGGICAASGVVLGHAFPVISNFKGGKCVASSTGLLFAFNPLTTLIILACGIASIAITGYVSAASITIFLLYPIASWFIPSYSLAFKIFLACLGTLILILHRANIQRLFKGQENPLFKKKKKNKELEEKNSETKAE